MFDRICFVWQRFLKIIVIVSAVKLLIACGGGVTGDAENFITVNDQTLVNLDTITISSASLQQSVWVVIYEADQLGSKSDVILGKKSLSADEYENITISLDRDVNNHETFYAELRKDSGLIGIYEPDTLDSVISQSAVTAISFTASFSTTPYISVRDQEIFENSITVSKVVSDQSAWLVAHRYDENSANNLGESVGHQKIAESNGKYPLHSANEIIGVGASQLNAGEVLMIALYDNANDVEGDNFNQQEDNLITVDGSPVVAQLTLIGEDNSGQCNNCEKFEIQANDTNTAYLWTAINRQNGEKTALNSNDVELVVGKIYQITNPSHFSHPLIFRDANNAILLSQSQFSRGSFENDLQVGWSDVNGVMTFTLTAELAAELANYVCDFHDAMTGEFIITP